MFCCDASRGERSSDLLFDIISTCHRRQMSGDSINLAKHMKSGRYTGDLHQPCSCWVNHRLLPLDRFTGDVTSVRCSRSPTPPVLGCLVLFQILLPAMFLALFCLSDHSIITSDYLATWCFTTLVDREPFFFFEWSTLCARYFCLLIVFLPFSDVH